MFLTGLFIGLIVGALTTGFVVKNNQDKAFGILDRLRREAEYALDDAKAELAKLKGSNTPSTPQA